MSVAEAAIESKVLRLLSAYFSKMHRKITRNSRLVEDLNADSVDIVEIVIVMEDAFNVELSSSQVAEWRSVVDIIKSIAEGGRMRAVIKT